MTLKSFITQLTKHETPKGPSPAFTAAHILEVLLILDSEKTMGRISLSKRLGIGEGSVRTIIKKLVEQSIISVDSVGGCHLTELGKTLISELKRTIIHTTELSIDEMGIILPSYAFQIRGIPLVGLSLTKLRDIAIKSGAEGMVIFCVKDGQISLPMMVDDVSKEYPKIANSLKSRFKLMDGDSILIGFSKDKKDSELATLSAVIFLLNA
jgi:predicted transcriptional regulator